MPFMALMAAPLSAMLSVTGDDGSLVSRARLPPIIYFGVTTCHHAGGRLGSPASRRAVQREHHRRDLTAFAPLASDRPEDLGSAVHGMPAVQPSAVETPL